MNASMQMADAITRHARQLDAQGLDLLFRQARSHNVWLPERVEPQQLRDLWELVQYAPTAVNGMPMRVIFVISDEGKQRLKPCLSPGNVDKVMAAPVTAIIGYDTAFWELLPQLFPHNDVRDMFREEPEHCVLSAFRNSTLQAAWLMLAARATGLDYGPMSGYDVERLDQAFFADTGIRSNFICNLGFGDPSRLFPRLPRLSFEEACTFA